EGRTDESCGWHCQRQQTVQLLSWVRIQLPLAAAGKRLVLRRDVNRTNDQCHVRSTRQPEPAAVLRSDAGRRGAANSDVLEAVGVVPVAAASPVRHFVCAPTGRHAEYHMADHADDTIRGRL